MVFADLASEMLAEAASDRLWPFAMATAMQCRFNWSMQHTRAAQCRRSVVDEATTEDLLLRQPEVVDVGALEARRDAS
jgi:hypothetical protein